MKKEFILRKCKNGEPFGRKVWVTWDIMRRDPDVNGEEFVAEFGECFRFLAEKAVKALNRND